GCLIGNPIPANGGAVELEAAPAIAREQQHAAAVGAGLVVADHGPAHADAAAGAVDDDAAAAAGLAGRVVHARGRVVAHDAVHQHQAAVEDAQGAAVAGAVAGKGAADDGGVAAAR